MRSLWKKINDLEPDAEYLEPASAILMRRRQPEAHTHVDDVDDAGTRQLWCGRLALLFEAIERPLVGSNEFDKPSGC